MIKRFLNIIILAALFTLSCDEKFIIVNCQECIDNEPTSASIEIKLESNQFYDVIVNIYEGNIEDNILVKSFSVAGSETEANLVVNIRYTITVKYIDNTGSQYIVVDTIYPRVRYETSQCEKPCYYVYDTKIKLKLKYT